MKRSNIFLAMTLLVSSCSWIAPTSTPEVSTQVVPSPMSGSGTVNNTPIAPSVIGHVQGYDIWTDDDVRNYFLDVWDWTSNDRHQFPTFQGGTTIPPWTINMAQGVPVDGENKPLPTQGWRLYEKHFNCIDYGQSTECDPSEDNVVTAFPHFSLYNIYTGVLRTFVFLNMPQALDKSVVVETNVVQGSDLENYHDYGLFLNSGEWPATLDTKSEDRNHGYTSVVPAFYGKWVVVDRYISYDVSEIPQDLKFVYWMSGVRTADIQLSGPLTEEGETEPGSSQTDLADVYDFVLGAGKTISTRIVGVVSTEKELKKTADSLQAKGYENLAGGVALIAAAFRTLGPAVGVTVAALEIVSSFTKIFGSHDIQYMPKTMTLEITGHLEGPRDLDYFAVGVSGSEQVINHDYTPILGNHYDGRLGLFSLARPPRFEVGDDYVMLLDDIRSLLLVNPDSNMHLVDLKIQPIVTVPGTQFCRGWEISNPLYGDVEEIPDFEGGNDPVQVRMTTEMVDPMDIGFTWNPRNGCYIKTNTGITDNSTVENILLKIYMKFEHNDPAHSNISAEFVRTYQANILHTNCSKGPSYPTDRYESIEQEWVEYATYAFHENQLQISTYTHRPCDMSYGDAIFFRDSYYRAIEIEWSVDSEYQLTGATLSRAQKYCRINTSSVDRFIMELGETGVGNDSLSSLMVAPFTEVTLYRDINLKGPSITFTQSIPKLSDYWNDRASSIRIRKNFAWMVPLLLYP